VGLLTSHELARKAAELADSKKAIDVVLLKLADVTDFVDYFVVCTAQSETQIRAVVDTIVEGLAKENMKVWSSEGRESRNWVLLDYVDVVVHVFLPETRTFYALEKLWGDASVESYPA
jgi:ribosome-associated protein